MGKPRDTGVRMAMKKEYAVPNHTVPNHSSLGVGHMRAEIVSRTPYKNPEIG
jgi:hypothetical protein